MLASSDVPQGNVAVTTRFILNGNAKEFDRLFRAHEDFLRKQDGFLGCHLLRSTSRPELFSHTGWWQSMSVYQDLEATLEFRAQVDGLSVVAEVADAEVFVTAT